jgi:formate dehydrogenase maturation protein FdhE
MAIATTNPSTWDARIARALELASSRPAAAELLSFYAALAEYQKSLAAGVRAGEEFDIDRVVDAIPGFLTWLRRAAPPNLATSVEEIDGDELSGLVASAYSTHTLVASAFRRKDASGGELPPDRLRQGSGESAGALRAKAEGGSHLSELDHENELDPALLFVVESILQAFAEHLMNQKGASAALGSARMQCPRCAGLPVAAVLREAGHGSKRFLLCALCLTEWECLRIVCTACGEEQFDKLPVYTAEQFPHVRIDACDRCHHYIKTIDLTKDGHAVPCVDDIASVSLDLWARERGYTRVKRNVLGI